MALVTSTLVNGEWTTTTLDVNSVLQHYDQQDKEATAKALEIEKPPVYGILSQTIVRSPQAHWILPVKLRTPNNNDVAFIGEDFVQIRELKTDGHLCDIIRKENFGAKIHNARVIGSEKAYLRDPETPYHRNNTVKSEDDETDTEMQWEAGRHLREQLNLPRPAVDVLPPQALLLHLDSGDFIFMMLRQTEDGGLTFVSNRRRVAKPMLSSQMARNLRQNSVYEELSSVDSQNPDIPSRAKWSSLQAGMHLTVDPSSRYMAIGCSQDYFAIYALHGREQLKSQWKDHTSTGAKIRHVQAERYLPVDGVIHKMEFLYPAADDEAHVILIVLVIRGGKTRMMVYEWQAGMDLRKIVPHSRRGHLLEPAYRMPLLLIPLLFKSAFILVSETSLAICQNILEGSPECLDFDPDIDPPTALHQGLSQPLWVSWARPIRSHQSPGRDHMYLAREDGLVKFYELDSEELVDADMTVGQFDCKISSAFASLEYQKVVEPFKGGDLLITSGDACNGGTYLILPRGSPSFTECIPNWSPSIDFTTTAQGQSRQFSESLQNKDIVPPKQKIYLCSGTGQGGAITEVRHGLEAGIGTIIPYDVPILDAWVLAAIDTPVSAEGIMFLLTIGDQSSLIRLSFDASEVEAVAQESTKFDLGHRTIVAKCHANFQVQVTEKTIIIADGTQNYYYDGNALLGTATAIEHAAIDNGVIVFTTKDGLDSRVHSLNYDSTQPDDSANQAKPIKPVMDILAELPSHITSLTTCFINQVFCTIFATLSDGFLDLIILPVKQTRSHSLRVPVAEHGYNTDLDAFSSISLVQDSADVITLLCGTGNGFLVILYICVSDQMQILDIQRQRLGATSVKLVKDENPSSSRGYFVTCDTGVYAFTPRAYRDTKSITGLPRLQHFESIWLTDATNPGLQQSEIVSIARLPDAFQGSEGGNLLVVAGTELMLARLSPQPRTVPRHLSIGCTPRRILYLQDLGVLVVAATVRKTSTLLFINPDTGEDLSKPVDKHGTPVASVAGLGKNSESILGLTEWSFTKDSKTWKYLVVTTSGGRVLLISYDKESHGSSKIQYYTRFKFKHDEQVVAVTGFPEGLFYCSGHTLCCDTLDQVEKKFKRVAEYNLSSPARSLYYENGKLYAVTSGHSLEVLDFVSENGSARLAPTHFDQYQRSSLHHLEVGLEPSISLVSDSDTSVVGLWATHNTKADTLDTVFEAELQHSVQRFRFGKCRPVWDPIWFSASAQRDGSTFLGSTLEQQYDIVPSTRSGAEILGLSIDGSLFHFTILGPRAWCFLRLVLNLASRSSAVCQFTYDTELPIEPALAPKTMMHVNGDILRRCLEERRLEDLLQEAQEREHVLPVHLRFVELLQELHGGMLETGASLQTYIDQAYLDLEFFLRPVL